MAKINNSSVIQKLMDELSLYPGKDIIPTEIADKILAVYNVNPASTVEVTPKSVNVIASAAEGGGSTSIIYTVPSTGDFYLTNVQLNLYNATGPAIGEAYVEVTVGGVTDKLLWVKQAAADSEAVSMSYPAPIKLDAGTNINLTCTSGSYDANATIAGYTE